MVGAAVPAMLSQGLGEVLCLRDACVPAPPAVA
jgi:hypothetical protein